MAACSCIHVLIKMPFLIRFVLIKKLRLCMEKVDQKAPEYIRMAESLK